MIGGVRRAPVHLRSWRIADGSHGSASARRRELVIGGCVRGDTGVGGRGDALAGGDCGARDAGADCGGLLRRGGDCGDCTGTEIGNKSFLELVHHTSLGFHVERGLQPHIIHESGESCHGRVRNQVRRRDCRRGIFDDDIAVILDRTNRRTRPSKDHRQLLGIVVEYLDRCFRGESGSRMVGGHVAAALVLVREIAAVLLLVDGRV